jgi:CBS-domain-containing membrane protein
MKFIVVGISILSLVFSTLALVNTRSIQDTYSATSWDNPRVEVKRAANQTDDFMSAELDAALATCQEDADGRRFAICFGSVGQKPTCSCAKAS